MDVPTAQEKSEPIFFAQPKTHQNKFADLNKTVTTNPLKMIVFFEQCQAIDKVAGILKKIAKDKKQPKERKMAHLTATGAVNQATDNITVTNTMITIKATNAIATIADLIIIIETINAMIVVNVRTRTQRATSPTKGRMIASAITPRKRAMRPCIMTSPLHQMPAICP
jgi:hypothetical protein